MRIGIIGHFGGKEKFYDGQTVKIIAIYDALKRYGFEDVDKIDSYYNLMMLTLQSFPAAL